MMHALKYKGSLADIAMRIRDGVVREYDLINCDEKRRAFMASMGIEGTVIRLRFCNIFVILSILISMNREFCRFLAFEPVEEPSE